MRLRVLVRGLDFVAGFGRFIFFVVGFFFHGVVRPFIELDICFKEVAVFVLIRVMMVELPKQGEKKENKMT